MHKSETIVIFAGQATLPSAVMQRESAMENELELTVKAELCIKEGRND